jgi:hypothetical protein
MHGSGPLEILLHLAVILGLGVSHEATRVHIGSRRRGGVAARGARAAAGDAGDWVPWERFA